MHIQHFEKGLHYSDKELMTVARKVGKLATYCRRLKNEDSFIRIEAERRETKKVQDSVKVSIFVSLPGKELQAESRRQQVIEALDRCVEKLEPQLIKYKEMKLDRGKRGRSNRGQRGLNE